MAEKSFKKIRCVHAEKNTIHFIPEHLLTDAYLKENLFVVQNLEATPEILLKLNVDDKKETVTEKAVVEKVVKAPNSKLVKK